MVKVLSRQVMRKDNVTLNPTTFEGLLLIKLALYIFYLIHCYIYFILLFMHYLFVCSFLFLFIGCIFIVRIEDITAKSSFEW